MLATGKSAQRLAMRQSPGYLSGEVIARQAKDWFDSRSFDISH